MLGKRHVVTPDAVGLHGRRRRRHTAPSPIKTAVAAWIRVEGSGITVEIEPSTDVNEIGFPSMSDSDVPIPRLEIVSVPEKVGLTV